MDKFWGIHCKISVNHEHENFDHFEDNVYSEIVKFDDTHHALVTVSHSSSTRNGRYMKTTQQVGIITS